MITAKDIRLCKREGETKISTTDLIDRARCSIDMNWVVLGDGVVENADAKVCCNPQLLFYFC
jgi:hypothetical protein